MMFSDALMLMVLGFSLAVPLGPVNMEMIKQALSKNKGWILSIMTGLGAMTGDFIIAFTSMTLGEQFLKNVIGRTTVKFTLFICNVAILTYIGVSGLKTQITEKETKIQSNNQNDRNSENDGKTKDSLLKNTPAQYGKGFLIVVTSPWSYLWWVSFGSYLLSSGIALQTALQRLLATILFLAGILCWVLLFSATLGISRKAASPNVLNVITKASASIILLFAVKIAYEAAKLVVD